MILDLYFLKLILPLLAISNCHHLAFVKMALLYSLAVLPVFLSLSGTLFSYATQRRESICVHMKLHCAYLLRNANELLGKSCVIKFYSWVELQTFFSEHGKRNEDEKEMLFGFSGIS